ncbi:FAD-dependent oxidoreductase [Geomonas sp.]|uniref:FAD-dependent oxidoreductase n=1 Tax=Geomonas sp. TaxID=2651584 RepID=UPI002B45D58A|nr:FAD-dependent oxidoreductase [Geomonas sp.]HJV34513.1 FAD-dependent oxidoreductase [Geomonas sp.]
MAKYVIVGGVAGGMSAAARLRRLDESAEIVVFERGDYVSYANCGLPYYLGGAITDRSQLLLQTPASFRQRFNVEVRTGHEVVAVLPQSKAVRVRELASRREFDEPYDQLLLAPGGSPVKPAIPGADLPAIHTLWTIPDTDRLHAILSGGTVASALIVGGGFIGLEMAENLHALGISVTLVEATPQVMSTIDFEMAALVHRELQLKGIGLRLQEAVCSFNAAPAGGVKATLTSGAEIGADLVLLAVGVAPNTAFLKDSGIELGPRRHIVVDQQMRTNCEGIFAVGDATEMASPFTGKSSAVPLAGPANKQGRIAADNMHGEAPRSYRGTMGTAIAKVFDLDVAQTGLTEKFCHASQIPCDSVIIHPNDHAGYYPGATQLTLKLVFSPECRKVLGAQAVGYSGVDKRIDVIATAIQAGMTVDDLCEIEHAYAPPYSSAKDPVNMAGFVAQNILDGLYKSITWDQLASLDDNHYLVDVRTPDEFAVGSLDGAINIPLDELRGRLDELPREKRIVLICKVGLRGYLAARILRAHGFTDCLNLSGGYDIFKVATASQPHAEAAAPKAEGMKKLENGMQEISVDHTIVADVRTVEVNACGLQCPGPVLRLKREIDAVAPGDLVQISASDPGFYSDVQAWARSTGNLVREIDSHQGTITALVEKCLPPQQAAAMSGGNDKTIIVFSGDLDKVIASFVIANGALAMGRKVTMFFTFWGINALRKQEKSSGLGKNLIEAAFGMMMPRGSRKLALSRMSMAGIGGKLIRGIMKNKNVPSLEEMMELAIRGGAQLVACQMSMDLMGIRREELIDGIEVGGVAAYLEASEHADNNLFI